MTATLDAVASRKSKPEPSAEERAAEEMVRWAREQGLSLTGPDGLLKQLAKMVLETALDQEMTGHLGHEKNEPAGNEAGDVRNGTRPNAKGLTTGEISAHFAEIYGAPVSKETVSRITDRVLEEWAVNAAAARAALDGLAEKRGKRYGAIVRLWENAWSEFIPFLDYDVEIRTVNLLDQRDRVPGCPLPAGCQGQGPLPERAGGTEAPPPGHPLP